MEKTDIYVGLNDQFTKQQKFETEKYVSILKNVCRSYKVAFSFNVIEGGYIHDSGEYTQETTLKLSLIGTPRETVEEIARDLCTFFVQESVLVTVNQVEMYYVNSGFNEIPEL